MKIEQYLQQLENACHKSLSATKSHGVRGAKMAQLLCIKEIREKLAELECLTSFPTERCDKIISPIYTWKKMVDNKSQCQLEKDHKGFCGVK